MHQTVNNMSKHSIIKLAFILPLEKNIYYTKRLIYTSEVHIWTFLSKYYLTNWSHDQLQIVQVR